MTIRTITMQGPNGEWLRCKTNDEKRVVDYHGIAPPRWAVELAEPIRRNRNEVLRLGVPHRERYDWTRLMATARRSTGDSRREL